MKDQKLKTFKSSKKPSLAKMVKNFTKAAIEFAEAGFPVVEEPEYEARLNTCLNCQFLIEKTMQCGKCGCFVKKKAAWKTSKCPEDYWPKA